MEPWYRAAELALVPPMQLWFNWRFDGLEKIPAEGPVIVAGNHLSYVDPLAHGYFVVKAGRRPRFLAKQELFDARFVGTVLRGARQISVERVTCDRSPLEDADHHDPRGLLTGPRQDRRGSTLPRDGGPDPPGRHVGGPVRLASVRPPEPHVRTADLGGRRRAVRPIRAAGW